VTRWPRTIRTEGLDIGRETVEALAPQIALLVLNWNGASLLREHLPAVVTAARAASVPTRVVVVDNASEDDSKAVVDSLDDVDWFPVAENKKLLAYNDAAQAIECEAFMVLNNDLSPPPETVDALWSVMRDQPDVFAVTGLMQNRDTGEWESGPTTLHWERHWVIDPTGRTHDTKPVDVAYVSGGASLIRRDLFLEIGGFWDALPSMYWEDVELGLRAWLHGYRRVFQPGLVFPHESGATTKQSISDFRRSAGVYRNQGLTYVSQLLHGRDLRDWLGGETRRYLRKPWLFLAAFTILPGLPAALRQRRRLRAAVGQPRVRELEQRWGS
jgi:GT2 family glycosyltransferase